MHCDRKHKGRAREPVFRIRIARANVNNPPSLKKQERRFYKVGVLKVSFLVSRRAYRVLGRR